MTGAALLFAAQLREKGAPGRFLAFAICEEIIERNCIDEPASVDLPIGYGSCGGELRHVVVCPHRCIPISRSD